MFSRRDLVRLIIPLVIEQVLAATIGIADTVMVSSVGEAAVSGVSLVDTLNLLLINVFAALATGGAIVVAQYLGRDDDENANSAAKQLLLVTTVLSVAIMAVCLMFQSSILHALFEVEPEVMQNALVYFSISAMSYPFISLYNACAALFRAQGNSKISMAASFVMNVINISGNALLIYGFGMGAKGAAISSLVSRAFSAMFLLVLLHIQRNRVQLESLLPLEFKPQMVKNILRIGVPNGLENGMFQIGKILVQGLIASFGTAAISANAMANSIATITIIPGNAISLALVTVVGQCIGAREYQQAKRYTLQLTGVAYLMVGGITILTLIALNPLVGAFGLSQEATETARWLCIVASIGNFVFWPASFTLPNGLRAANDVRFTMLTSIFSMWVFRVGSSYLLGQWLGYGVIGVWIAMIIDWVFRSACFITRLLRGKWMNKQLI